MKEYNKQKKVCLLCQLMKQAMSFQNYFHGSFNMNTEGCNSSCNYTFISSCHRNGGIFRRTPWRIRSSSMSKPRSAITESPLSSKSNRPLFLVSSLCSTSVAVDMPLQHSESPTEIEIPISKNVQVQTEINGNKFDSLTNEVSQLECTVENQRFCLSNVSKDESKLCFNTKFTSFAALMACYNFLEPAVNSIL